MSLNRRLRRQAFLERHGKYYAIGQAGSQGGNHGHPFRGRRTAERWARVRTKVSRARWSVYRFDR